MRSGEKASGRASALPVDTEGNPIEFLQLKNDLPDWDDGARSAALAHTHALPYPFSPMPCVMCARGVGTDRIPCIACVLLLLVVVLLQVRMRVP